jgi:hypothetical protein
VLILTSNLGAEEMERANLGFGESDRTEDDDAMKRFFAPEFRNRLDAIVKFKKLSKDTMKFYCEEIPIGVKHNDHRETSGSKCFRRSTGVSHRQRI